MGLPSFESALSVAVARRAVLGPCARQASTRVSGTRHQEHGPPEHETFVNALRQLGETNTVLVVR